MKNAGPWFLTISLILVSFEPALGCWCARKTLYTEYEFKAAVAEEYRSAAVVFSGEVIEKNQTQVKFKVAKVWKGTVSDEVVISSEYYMDPESIVLCAYSSFKIGKRYLVYADLFEKQLQVHECSRTNFLNKAYLDMKVLDQIKDNEPSANEQRAL